jgi:hypothetical protein
MASEGADILEDLYEFLGRFIAYPSDQGRVAHVLWIAHCHLIEAFDATPRLAFLSAEPASGKTRALELTELVVPNPIEAVNISPAALFRIVGGTEDDDGRLPTILFDEIDTVFGLRAKENEEIRGLLNAGHRRGAKTYRCAIHGKSVEPEAIEAFAPVALAGLGWLPDTIMSRAVVVRMKRRAPNERVEPYRRRDFAEAGHLLHDRLQAWAESALESVREARPDLPPSIEDRNADKWEPMIAVADAAGGDWPDRARAAAVALVKEASTEHLPSLGIQLLSDLRTMFAGAAMRTDDILAKLRELSESPWADMKGKPIDARRLANLLRQYGVKSKNVRMEIKGEDKIVKGYSREDLHDAWLRNLPAEKSATSATPATSQHQCGFDGVAAKSNVADHPLHVAAGHFEKAAPNGHVAHVAHVADILGQGADLRASEDDHDAFEERSAILEFDAGLPRAEAERRARAELRLDDDPELPACLDRRAGAA